MDVVDDEDVALMIDEWREAVAGGASNLRLHIFVQVITILCRRYIHICMPCCVCSVGSRPVLARASSIKHKRALQNMWFSHVVWLWL